MRDRADMQHTGTPLGHCKECITFVINKHLPTGKGPPQTSRHADKVIHTRGTSKTQTDTQGPSSHRHLQRQRQRQGQRQRHRHKNRHKTNTDTQGTSVAALDDEGEIGGKTAVVGVARLVLVLFRD